MVWVLIKGGDPDIQTGVGGGAVTSQGCLESSEAGKGKEGSSPRDPGGANPTDPLNVDFWPPENENKFLQF